MLKIFYISQTLKGNVKRFLITGFSYTINDKVPLKLHIKVIDIKITTHVCKQ